MSLFCVFFGGWWLVSAMNWWKQQDRLSRADQLHLYFGGAIFHEKQHRRVLVVDSKPT
jgi:hypothetical protein